VENERTFGVGKGAALLDGSCEKKRGSSERLRQDQEEKKVGVKSPVVCIAHPGSG